MLYLHIIDTKKDPKPTKSMFVEEGDVYELGRVISLSEPDNIIIINSIEIDRDTLNKRIVKIKHVFLNGNEDTVYSGILKVNKKNN